jgi:chromate transporter
VTDLSAFLTFLKASLLSTGGQGNLPILHAELIAHGVAREQQFGESLAIGQLAPGPTGLWVISLGFLVFGLTGALIATAAILIPPFGVLVVEMGYGRLKDAPAVRAFVRSFSLSVSTISITVLALVLKGAGASPKSLVIAAIAAGLAASKKIPIAVIIGIAAVVGVAFPD